jgi:hypothetical protein
MTPSRTTTIETLSSPPTGSPKRRVLSAAALASVALGALVPWLFTTSPDTESGLFATASTAAPQAITAPDQTNTDSNASSVHRPAEYIQFCHNSPSLCIETVPTSLAIGYRLFCENSPTLCLVANHR